MTKRKPVSKPGLLPATAWDLIAPYLPQKAATPLRLVARALGVDNQTAQMLLTQSPTKAVLFDLNRRALYRYLAIVRRTWPHCPWFDWQMRERDLPPVIHIITNALGHRLLDEVAHRFGEDVVQDYWLRLKLPEKYIDSRIDLDADDPLANIPADHIVSNPHLEDEDEVFIFGSAEAAACFRWVLEDRQHYSHFISILTSYHHDPLGIEAAYDLRDVLQEEYWATLPPDTLPSYLNIVRSLQSATVPEGYEDGGLSLLGISRIGQLPSQGVQVVQATSDRAFWRPESSLLVPGQPVNVFVLDPDTGAPPAAVILTTEDDPGDPEQHRRGESFDLPESEATESLAFVSVDVARPTLPDLEQVETLMEKLLDGQNYGQDTATGILAVNLYDSVPRRPNRPIRVFRMSSGYLLQFDARYTFAPNQMEVRND